MLINSVISDSLSSVRSEILQYIILNWRLGGFICFNSSGGGGGGQYLFQVEFVLDLFVVDFLVFWFYDFDFVDFNSKKWFGKLI